MENVEVRLEHLNRVVIRHIKRLKLLDNHQDEQVEHDMGDHHDKANIVDGGKGGPTRLAGDAVWWRVDAVVHHLVPVLASRDPKQQEDGTEKLFEVLVVGIENL